MAARELALIAACVAATVAGCGGRDEPPAFDPAVGAWLVEGATDIEFALIDLDGCRARERTQALAERARRADAAGDVPRSLRPELRNRVRTLARAVECRRGHQPRAARLHETLRDWLEAQTAAPERGDDLRLPSYAFDSAADDLPLIAAIPLYPALDTVDAVAELEELATEGQWRLFVLLTVDGEVANGGFEQLFGTQGVAFAREAAGAAAHVGAPQHARLIERAVERRTEAATLGELDEAWYANERALQRALHRYVVANRDEFFRERAGG